MAKRKGGAFFWIALIVVGVILYQRFGANSETEGEQAAAPAVAGNSYATRPLQNTWPSDAGGGVSATLGAVNYYLVMDGSGSMNSDECGDGRPKIEVAVEAVKAFVDTVPAEANLGLTVFDSMGIGERVALGSGNRAEVVQQLDAIMAENSTPLRSSITIGYEALTAQAKAQLGYGEYHLVVVTDGYAEPAEEDPGEIVQTILQQSPVVLHVIGFCIGEEHVLNQPGRTLYTAANNTAQLREGLASVLAESPDFSVADFTQ